MSITPLIWCVFRPSHGAIPSQKTLQKPQGFRAQKPKERGCSHSGHQLAVAWVSHATKSMGEIHGGNPWGKSMGKPWELPTKPSISFTWENICRIWALETVMEWGLNGDWMGISCGKLMGGLFMEDSPIAWRFHVNFLGRYHLKYS